MPTNLITNFLSSMYKTVNSTQFLSLAEHLNSQKVDLVAVSKTHPPETLKQVYDLGQRIFGENRVQELVQKHEQLPKDIHWHFIGHLQTNKVKYIAPFVSLIHAVDSLRLLKEIDKQAANHDRVIDCLLQVHIAEESSKFGFSEAELQAFLAARAWQGLKNIRLVGLMGMATFTDDTKQVKKEFLFLKKIFDQVQKKYFGSHFSFKTLSMGMSGDYELAIQAGSTMVRIGSLIFGNR